jgi:hypothetical protein
MRRDLEKVAQNVNEELPRLRTAFEYLTVGKVYYLHARNLDESYK